MDPLGAIASTVTLVGATIKVSEGVPTSIGSIRYLLDELLATSNDVTDFRLVLVSIQDTIAQEELLVGGLEQGHSGGQLAIDGNMPAAAAPQASTMVQEAQNKRPEIEEVVRKTKTIQNTKGFAALDRIRLLKRTKTATGTQQHTTKLDDLPQQISPVDGLEQAQQRTSNLLETLIKDLVIHAARLIKPLPLLSMAHFVHHPRVEYQIYPFHLQSIIMIRSSSSISLAFANELVNPSIVAYATEDTADTPRP
jgi:hypothetical protein